MAGENKRIRILFTIPNFDTAGSGKALLNIAIRLDPTRFEPHIMCMHDRGDFFQVVKQSGIPVHLLQYTTTMKPYWSGLLNCWKISRQLKHLAPDIIHSFHYAADYSEPLAARMAGIKWMYTKKNMNWGDSSKNAWKFRSWLAYFIIAQNKDMIRDFFCHSDKAHLIPRGVNILEFKPQTTATGKQNTTKVLLNVSNLVPVKGIETILKAMVRLREEKNRTVMLKLVGDDKSVYATQLKNCIKEWKLDNQVIFEGRQNQIAKAYADADVFVLSSLKESSPVALLEAMAAGVPVLSSKTAGACEIMGDFEEQIFEVDDDGSLANKIDALLTMERYALGLLIDRQRERILARHTIEDEVNKHVTLYELLV